MKYLNFNHKLGHLSATDQNRFYEVDNVYIYPFNRNPQEICFRKTSNSPLKALRYQTRAKKVT